MKRRTIYDLTAEDREAIKLWMQRKKSYREMGEILGIAHESVRIHLAGFLRQMYEEGDLKFGIYPLTSRND